MSGTIFEEYSAGEKEEAEVHIKPAEGHEKVLPREEIT